jgi:hypothetical protein
VQLRDEQRERTGAGRGAPAHVLDERGRGGRAVGDDEHAASLGVLHGNLLLLVRIIALAAAVGQSDRG